MTGSWKRTSASRVGICGFKPVLADQREVFVVSWSVIKARVQIQIG
jgi:hypothetical protein